MKTAIRAVFLSFLFMTNKQLSIKSSPESLIMLFKPLTSSIAPPPTLSHSKKSEKCLRKTIFALYQRGSRTHTAKQDTHPMIQANEQQKLNCKRIEKGSYNQMRSRSIGLNQMKGLILESKRETTFKPNYNFLLLNIAE